MSEETENISEETQIPKVKLYYDQRSVALRTTQSVCFVQEHDKITLLDLLLNDYKETQVVIVVKSKKKADTIHEFLESRGLRASAVHGNHKEEKLRESTSVFNSGLLNIIITTDMILKTLELENIKLVISYDLPDNLQEYFNRLAYMKEEGEAIALVSPDDDRLLSTIELNMKQELDEKTIDAFVPSVNPGTSKKLKKKPRHRKRKPRKESQED